MYVVYLYTVSVNVSSWRASRSFSLSSQHPVFCKSYVLGNYVFSKQGLCRFLSSSFIPIRHSGTFVLL